MRSVFIYLGDAHPAEVEDYLTRTCPFQPGPPWILDIAGDPALHISINRDPGVDDQIRLLGHEPGLTVTADVSGRHAGDREVWALVCGLLDRFGGVAHDEYTTHHWTSEEISSGLQVQGRPFFDYCGWYEEDRHAST